MDKNKILQAEKLQTKLDKLLKTKEKKQASFEKLKQEVSSVSKEIEIVKLKLFEILQNGSDDTTFSNWAKKRISEKNENGNPVIHERTITKKSAVVHATKSKSVAVATMQNPQNLHSIRLAGFVTFFKSKSLSPLTYP